MTLLQSKPWLKMLGRPRTQPTVGSVSAPSTGLLCESPDPPPAMHTDNIFALKAHCVKKHSMVSSEFDKALGIPEDLDYFA